MSPIVVYNCEQGSPEWYRCRAGIPSASNFSKILAKGEGKTRRTYLYDLGGELLTGEPTETYSNGFMERGKRAEDEARDWYIFQTGATLQRVGFIFNEEWQAGASPDGLIGEDGGLEIKTRMPRLQMELLEDGRFPNEHRAQVQGNMGITGRKWWDFVSYCRGLPPFKLRVFRDDAYITELRLAVGLFNGDLQDLVRKFSEAA